MVEPVRQFSEEIDFPAEAVRGVDFSRNFDIPGETGFFFVDPGSADPRAGPNRGPLRALPGGVNEIAAICE